MPATESSGQVRILKDLSGSIEGRHVIVVEDIIDTGLTLNYLLKYLADKGPASISIVLPARQAGAPPGRDPDRLHAASRSRIASSSATASTTTSATATCRTSAS